jgi:hypothetical protein
MSSCCSYHIPCVQPWDPAGPNITERRDIAPVNPVMGRIKIKSIKAYANQTARSVTVAEQVSMVCHLLSAGAGT